MNFKVGDKVRIVKCVVFFSPKIFLGKVDTIVHVDDYIELEKYKSVPWYCVEKVEQDAVDEYIEYTKECEYSPRID